MTEDERREREAVDSAVQLGDLYKAARAETYACTDIFCTYPHDGNCDCFNTALARYTAIARGDHRKDGE